MSYSPTELEALVHQRAPEIARDIRNAAERARSESDLVTEVEHFIKRFEKTFGFGLHLDRERTLVNGRADAVYNRFVIEYEPPGSLQRSNTYRHNQHAIGQVKHYMEGMERLDRHKKERLAGVVLDGFYYIFIRYRGDHWWIDDPLPVDAHSTETFLHYLLSLSTELALTPENLVRDFGENSNTARQVVPVLYRALRGTDNPMVRTLFRQWQRQFHEISGYDPDSQQLDTTALARLYAVRDRAPDLEHLFFAIHTYYAAFIKVLALQVVYYYLIPERGTGLAVVATYEKEQLHAYLTDMERGGLFAQLGIRNFLEGDFFGWYLEIWDSALNDVMRRLIGDLANYSLVTLDVDPEETRDLLKQLYQNLVPKKLRHALGEYYTPDWLADRLLNQLGYDGNPSKRLLDPACGSGTFLVLAIRRVRQYSEEKKLSPSRVLEQILDNIVGFDLNPLAVISARANYLLALGDLLAHRDGEINIPVYLADSILTPSQGDDLFTMQGYTFNTSVGRFSVPRSLVAARYIDHFTSLLEECVKTEQSSNKFEERLVEAFPLDRIKDEAEIKLAIDLYHHLIELEHQQIDGIWARIIKNAFAPLFQERFDYVAGNPPWVNWESLPEDYRELSKPLWELHGLFVSKGQLGKMREGKKDISMLMTYVAADSYLKDQGRLGFVITQTVFKTPSTGRGFRRFLLRDGTPLGVISVDDLSKLKPFEGASNRTAILVLVRGRETRYPLRPYSYWYKPGGGSVISEQLLLNDIVSENIISYHQFAAEPIDKGDPTSTWITGHTKAIDAIRNVLGSAAYRAHAGSYTGGANGVYWLEVVKQSLDNLVVVSNFREGARRQVDSVQTTIETDLVYPLLRGQDVQKWESKPSLHILVVQDTKKQREGIPEAVLKDKYPKTYAYLSYFREILTKRPDKKYYPEGSPFYTMRNVASYTFAPYKVVWREQANVLTAAVAHSEYHTVIPDHKLMLVSFEDEFAAHYLCAALNSSPAQFITLSYAINVQMDTHILENIRVPLYSSENYTHKELALLSQQAHKAKSEGNVNLLNEIEADIDRMSARLWKLSSEEMKEIQDSLTELS